MRDEGAIYGHEQREGEGGSDKQIDGDWSCRFMALILDRHRPT